MFEVRLGYTFFLPQKLLQSLVPNDDWGPSDLSLTAEYRAQLKSNSPATMPLHSVVHHNGTFHASPQNHFLAVHECVSINVSFIPFRSQDILMAENCKR